MLQVKADRDRGILYGETEIDLTYVEQLVDSSQTRFVMDCLVGRLLVVLLLLLLLLFLLLLPPQVWLGQRGAAALPLPLLLDRLEEEMASPSLPCPLDLVSPWAGPNGAYTRWAGHYSSFLTMCCRPRRLEIAAAINRLRTLKIVK